MLYDTFWLYCDNRDFLGPLLNHCPYYKVCLVSPMVHSIVGQSQHNASRLPLNRNTLFSTQLEKKKLLRLHRPGADVYCQRSRCMNPMLKEWFQDFSNQYIMLKNARNFH